MMGHQPRGIRCRRDGPRLDIADRRRAALLLDEPGRDPRFSNRCMQLGKSRAQIGELALRGLGAHRRIRRGRDFTLRDRELAVEPCRIVPQRPQRLGPTPKRELGTHGSGRFDRLLPRMPRNFGFGQRALPPFCLGKPTCSRLRRGESHARCLLRLLCDHELALGVRARVVGEHRDRECGALPFAQSLLGQCGAQMRADRQLRVDLGAGHALEQLAAVFAVGAQERRELALREQRAAPELIERQTQPLMDCLERLGLRTADRGPEPCRVATMRARSIRAMRSRSFGTTFELDQRDLLALKATVRRAACAPYRPARPISPRVAALEVDLGPARARTASQQRPHILRTECRRIVFAPDDNRAAIREPRRAIEQRDAHRVEQRALARARWADDREHARAR
jgi:hypothetical protein